MLGTLLDVISRFVNVNTLLIIIVAILIIVANRKPSKIVISPPQGKNTYVQVVRMLSDNEKRVLDVLIDKKGRALQSEVTRITKLPRWQTSRILNRFEHLGWIVRKPYGMTKMIEVSIEFE